jgi:hypothetical protein
VFANRAAVGAAAVDAERQETLTFVMFSGGLLVRTGAAAITHRKANTAMGVAV